MVSSTQILDHGWLKYAPSCYLIDLELSSFTDYIDYQHCPEVNRLEERVSTILDDSGAVCVRRTSPLSTKIRNIWEIGRHSASGLEFMPRCGLVYRDLKPRNGIAFKTLT